MTLDHRSPQPADGASHVGSAIEGSPVGTPLRLSRSDRLGPLLLIGAIGLGLGVDRIAPGFAGSLLPLVTVGVGFLIYLIMLGLDVDRLRWGSDGRRFVLTTVILNFGVVPVLAWGLGATMLGDHPDLRVGLLLFLVTPCIGWYLVFIDLAAGDTALGVSLLGINLVLQVLLLPLYLQLFAGASVGADPQIVVRSVVTYLVVPAALAIATRAVLDRHRRTVRPPSRTGGSLVGGLTRRVPSLGMTKTITLLVVVTSMFASQADVLEDDPSMLLRVVAPIVAYFAIVFVLTLVVARVRRMSFERTVVLVFTTASRNSEASLAIAVTAFASPLVAAVVAIGPAIELPILVLMVRMLSAVGRRWPAAPQPVIAAPTRHDIALARAGDDA